MDNGNLLILPPRLKKIDLTIRYLQSETILPVLLWLYIGGFLLMITSSYFQDPLKSGLSAVILVLLAFTVWGLYKVSYRAASWTLIIGCVVVDLFIATFGGITAAIVLLALPIGLAVLFISLAGGLITATACTLFLLFAPSTILASDPMLRFAAIVEMWGVIGIMGLAIRTWLTTVQWYKTNYEQGYQLVEQTRDTQFQLTQALKDLAGVNIQLQRLNILKDALRQEAEEARRIKEQFVTNVSHELRTPLNMITGFAETIVQSPELYGGNLPPILLADLNVILRNGQHLSKLIDDVLDLSQLEVGQMALTKERVQIQDIIQAAVTAVRPLFESKGLYLKTDISENLPPTLCDQTRIREVLLNLLSNAGRFTEQGGVSIRVWQDGRYIITSVTDTGPGIAPEQKDKIFQPFHQLDGSIRRRYGGSGLGLSISKSFVELHGGKIWFESEQENGTTFFFRLPIDPPIEIESNILRWFNPHLQYQERTFPSKSPVPIVRTRFVVLEAGKVLQRLLTRYFNDVEVVSVKSIEEAIEELQNTPTRALLINNPSRSETIHQLGESNVLPHNTSMIICSIPEAYEEYDPLGISNYLIKPISREALLGALDQLKLKGKTILLIDDEPDALRLYRRMLVSAGRGYRVLRATDGRQAFDMLRNHYPDAILLDLVMPNMDGYQFLTEKKTNPTLRDVPVIIISARDPTCAPVVSKLLTVTKRGGLSTSQIFACIDVISGILSGSKQSADLTPLGELGG